MSPYEILEHTADIGLLARGETPEQVFEDATVGMLEIAGVWHPGDGATVEIEVEGPDLAAVLVDWLSEVLYVQDARNLSIGGVNVEAVSQHSAKGSVSVRPFTGDASEGVQIKAVTYHQLSVEQTNEGWTARVFFDV